VLIALPLLLATAAPDAATVQVREQTILIGEPAKDEATDAGVAAGVTRIVEAEARSALRGWKVVSFASVRATLDTAVQLACLGDGELTAACTSEIGDALGARAILTMELGRVGSLRLLTLTLVDSQDASVLAQEVRRVPVDEDGPLLDAAAAGTREVLETLGAGTGTDDPPAPLEPAAGAPTNTLAWTAIGVGAAIIVGAAAAQTFAVTTYHQPWADGTATREAARSWEETWFAWHGLSVLGYAVGAAGVVAGASMLRDE
jgi:hypothetical protein